MGTTSALRLSLLILLGLLLLAGAAWGVLALYYQGPGNRLLKGVLLSSWCLLQLLALYLLASRGPGPCLAILLAAWLPLLLWWHAIEPSNQREWADDVARTLHGEQVGERLILRNVRNFHWRSETDYDIHWETHEYDLRHLVSLDVLLSYWSSPAIAHTLVSFGFEDGRQLVLSVEIRKERDEAFSELGGFFKSFETSIIAADERDIVHVRTNVRGEDVYLYRLDMPREAMASLLLAYVEQANALSRQPRFYHTLTANCTTIVYQMMRHIVDGLPMDYRILLSGYLPGYLQRVDALQPGYSLDALQRLGRITSRALDSGHAEDFSQRIRQGVPGIAQ